MLEKVSQIHKTYLLDQQLFCWRHFSKTEVVQNTDVNILALYRDFFLESLEVKTIETYAFTFLSLFFGFSWCGDFFFSQKILDLLFLSKIVPWNWTTISRHQRNSTVKIMLLLLPFFCLISFLRFEQVTRKLFFTQNLKVHNHS